MNSIPKTITAEWLTVHDACEEQQALFEKTWPDGAHVTKTSLVQAAKVGLNLQWFAERVLPRSLYADYRAKRAPLDADYQAKRDALYADYRAKCAPLDADYQAKRDALNADYQAKYAPLYADYQAKRAPLYADYQAKRDALNADYQAKCDALLIEIIWAARTAHGGQK